MTSFIRIPMASATSSEPIAWRKQANPDILWIKDDSLQDTKGRTPADHIAEEIVENFCAAGESV